MELTRPRQNSVSLWLALVCMGLVLAVTLPALAPHAIERHGTQALVATQWVAAHGGPGNRWDCRDGRQRWIVPYGAREWAIVVVEGAVQVTAFITSDQDYVNKMHEGCKQWQNWAHP